MSIQILDIYWGNKFDAEQEKATGTDGVIIKAGQGSYLGYLANKCNYIDECERVGLPWGLYWLYDARYSPEAHKAAIKQYYPDGNFGELGIWIDCEKPTLATLDRLYRKMPYAYYKPIESFWRGIAAYTGKYPGIYTSPGAWDLIFGAIPGVLATEMADKSPLWVAHYGVSSPKSFGAWKDDWLLWQYQGEPDYSVFNGTEREFYEYFGLYGDDNDDSGLDQTSVPIPTPSDDELESVVLKYKSGKELIFMEKQ